MKFRALLFHFGVIRTVFGLWGIPDHKMDTDAKNCVIKAFKNAPIAYPFPGSDTLSFQGIRLHIDDAGKWDLPLPFNSLRQLNGGSMGGGGSLNWHEDFLQEIWEDNLYDNKGWDGNSNPDNSGNHGFNLDRHGTFYYCIFAHHDEEEGDLGESAGDEMQIFDATRNDATDQAHTFLHELGHRLGLAHDSGPPGDIGAEGQGYLGDENSPMHTGDRGTTYTSEEWEIISRHVGRGLR